MCFIRHGERCDNSDDIDELNRVDNEYDPPLTKLGISQAHVCGQYLRKYLERGGYDRMVIEASPFLRCMETAAAIAKELGLPEVDVNYRCAEWLKLKFFPHGTPVPDLEINKCQEAEYSEKWLQGIRFKHNKDFVDDLNSRHPERYDDCGRRIEEFAADLLKQYRRTDLRTAHLVVTHGIGVKHYADMVYRKSTSDESGSRPRVRVPHVVDYTGIASATVKGRSVRITLGGSAAHLKDDAAKIHMDTIQVTRHVRKVTSVSSSTKNVD